ncbi:hypothetical protein PTKIN_Ptkin03bG0029500 [Pterospermum kingtungense]
MTPQEERLVLELHAKWGNRWSRIARKLPGRTDNEIKNYWRTHMRKEAQEKKRAMSPSSSSSNNPHSSSSTTTTVYSVPFSGTGKVSFFDTGGSDMKALSAGKHSPAELEDEKGHYYSMDDIWKDIDMSEEINTITPLSDNYSEEGCNFSCPSMAAANYSLSWEYSCWDSLWNMMDGEETKMFLPTTNQSLMGEHILTG